MRGLAAANVAALFTTAALVTLGAPHAKAQRFPIKRLRTFVVGRPLAASATDRVDAQRTGRSASPLPRGPLTIAWKRALGLSLDRAPVVTRDGEVLVVAARGEVVTLAPDGTEKARIPTGVLASGATALLSDGTFLFLSAGGEAIGVRAGRECFRTRVAEGRAASSRVAPLPLEDGGVAVAVGAELVALDAEGGVRARRTLPEPPAVPLVDAAGKVIAIGPTGTVYGWTPDQEPVRVGSFGGPLDDAAAFDGARDLVAVVGAGQLVSLDVARGVTLARAASVRGIYLGPPAVGRDGSTYLLAQEATRTVLLALDPSGRETAALAVASFPPVLAPDGGPAPVSVPAHTGLLVDAEGAVLFAAPNGNVGVARCNTPPCAVDALAEAPCLRAGASGGRTPGGVVGMAPAGPGAAVLACENGSVLRLEGGR